MDPACNSTFGVVTLFCCIQQMNGMGLRDFLNCGLSFLAIGRANLLEPMKR